jgi:hypothetical protein
MLVASWVFVPSGRCARVSIAEGRILPAVSTPAALRLVLDAASMLVAVAAV